MLIHKVSPISNKLNSMEIDVTCSQIYDWEVEGMLIQQAMPNLTPRERDFISIGIGPKEWDDMYGGDDFEEHEYLDLLEQATIEFGGKE